MTNEVLIAVPLFIFMGTMLERSRIAEELLENMGRLFGKMRGGLGVSVILVGALLACLHRDCRCDCRDDGADVTADHAETRL